MEGPIPIALRWQEVTDLMTEVANTALYRVGQSPVSSKKGIVAAGVALLKYDHLGEHEGLSQLVRRRAAM